MFLIVLTLFFYNGTFNRLTGKVSSEISGIGPSAVEQACMMSCVSVGCDSNDMACKEANGNKCQQQCNVVKPEQTSEESCVETCVQKGCGEFDFPCQQKNQAICDKECGMIKEPKAKSEEEQCIRDCVNSKSPGLICQAGEGRKKGNEICQSCAKSCKYLYAGPCLTEIKLEEAKSACNTCEHCYEKPIMGDSGEGYECIVSIECADASAEFGDNPGTGSGVITAKIGDAIGNVFESIGNFFSGFFNNEASEETSQETPPESPPESLTNN
ncbi:hypothetical protein J4217_02810 [Candidatus Pacearchaeota archaeon]|nr:hypothetical protein [Candidatus Pacearchaeota archaeon]